MTPTIVGAAALAIMGSLAVQLVPDLSTPIVLNTLSYSEGMMTVDRTVTTDKPAFFMRKSSQIVNTATGESIPECEGIKNENFREGRVKATVTMATWSGNPLCTPEVLGSGQFVPLAVYIWGDHQKAFMGEPFTVGGVRG